MGVGGGRGEREEKKIGAGKREYVEDIICQLRIPMIPIVLRFYCIQSVVTIHFFVGLYKFVNRIGKLNMYIVYIDKTTSCDTHEQCSGW